MLIDQERIDRFAAATGDRQWIHIDSERCRRDSRIGCTVAHGFLTLSMLSSLMQASVQIGGIKMGLNYGLNKVRFPAPVPVGSRIRGRFKLLSLTPEEEWAQVVWQVTLEKDDAGKPACIAEFIVRYYPAAG